MSYILRYNIYGALCALALAVQITQPAQAADPFKDGVEQFNNKRYHAAAELFTEAERSRPNDQKVHIYMGRTLEALKDPAGAQAEYEACFRINPFNTDGLAAKSALLNLSSSEAAKANAPLDDSQTVRQTIRTIQRQTNQAKNNYLNWADVIARQRLVDGAREAQYERDRASWSLAGLRSNRRYDPYYANEISNRGTIRSHYIYTDSQAQAFNAWHWGTRQARFLQESANNLMSQIDQKPSLPGDAVLRAKGTNLYVRYYGAPEQDDVPPQDPPEELRAVAKKLNLPAHPPKSSTHS